MKEVRNTVIPQILNQGVEDDCWDKKYICRYEEQQIVVGDDEISIGSVKYGGDGLLQTLSEDHFQWMYPEENNSYTMEWIILLLYFMYLMTVSHYHSRRKTYDLLYQSRSLNIKYKWYNDASKTNFLFFSPKPRHFNITIN